MKDLLAKARRLRTPKSVSVSIRPEVYEWLKTLAESADIPCTIAARAVLEGAYDRYCDAALDPEVAHSCFCPMFDCQNSSCGHFDRKDHACEFTRMTGIQFENSEVINNE